MITVRDALVIALNEPNDENMEDFSEVELFWINPSDEYRVMTEIAEIGKRILEIANKGL